MQSPPTDILIIGSGVFGLTTAWALTKRPFFADTSITIVDDVRGQQFPPSDCASFDSSRIVRADYADPDYADLAAAAQEEWRKQGDDELGGQGRYSESGLLLTAYEPSKHARVGKKTAWEYSKASFENVSRIAEDVGAREKVREFEGSKEIQEFLEIDSHPGDWGYINKLSGWANAGKGMAWLYERVKATDRVKFVDAKVEELVTERKKVVGAKLNDSRVLRAELVFVAAGAWTGSLIDLRGRIEATAQPLGYVDITAEEFQVAAKLPVVLNFTSGLFIIPPQEKVLKIARHSYGYLNPVTVTTALPPSPSEERKPIVVSRPMTYRDGTGTGRLPSEADRALRQALQHLTPLKGLESRPWKETRLCWYADTCDGDWLVDWHPGWDGLFIATGDSGHAYKFLPVLGDKFVDCLIGKGDKLGEKWKWKEIEDDGLGSGREIEGKFVGLITDDGSRGGEPGLVLQEELNK
ncbi:L-pipecolate oxidase [Cladobotryum mycophilum]|uniref:L-pipecolate oxidase n=1 Tax=Cladobotryum mycophilum TaxID=491253 RepID=A0ABR0STS5_9HYPO